MTCTNAGDVFIDTSIKCKTGSGALAAVSKLIEALEEHDDVKEVFSNADAPEEAVKS